MEHKKKIALAAELLRGAYGYINGDNSGKMAFDFIVGDDGSCIYVFNADTDDETFYWPETVVHILDAVGLVAFVDYSAVKDGKKQVVTNIH